MSEKWDERFIDLARHISQWSKDPSTKVGASRERTARFARPVQRVPKGVPMTRTGSRTRKKYR